jgi:hypothetical protein
VARDSSLFVRQATLAFLKEQPTVVALVPAERVYPPQRPPNPTWPFIGYGVPGVQPFVASCLDGSRVSVAIHTYAETTGEGDETIGGEEMAAAIAAVVVAALDGATLPLDQASGGVTDCPYPATAHFTWTGTQVLQDRADASAFHGVASFDITVSS